MQTYLVNDKEAQKSFKDVQKNIYKDCPFYRGTESSIEDLLLFSESAFKKHAQINKYLIRDGNDIVGRFALIDDSRQKTHIQVSFFEAQRGLGDIFSLIKDEIKKSFPHRKNVIVGLNGHLNYGAGILLNRFDEAPLFGLPYNHDYYAGYFKNLQMKKMVSFRFTMEVYHAWAQTYNVERTLPGLNIRFMNKKRIKDESALYTYLNNQAFFQHPFWADRDKEEDQELFYPFRHLLDNQNLIFAEINGKVIGFFLWYPDFNQLVASHRELNLWDVIKYRLGNKCDTFRFTEIGIVPEYQRSPVALALINKSLPVLLKKGYSFCEGGFIFEENVASMAFVKRILKRCYGTSPEPYREFAVFETTL